MRRSPRSAPDTTPDIDPDTRENAEPPARVLLHNDDFTPMEFVTQVLHDVFGLAWHRALWVMLRAHTTGVALVDVLPRALAEQRAERAMALARAGRWPLLLTVEVA